MNKQQKYRDRKREEESAGHCRRRRGTGNGRRRGLDNIG